MKTVSLVILFTSSFWLAYNLGERKGLNVYEHSVQSNAAERYIERLGNPSTKKEQCDFDYVIYGDTSECR